MSLKMDNMISVKHEIDESACRRGEEREKGIFFFFLILIRRTCSPLLPISSSCTSLLQK